MASKSYPSDLTDHEWDLLEPHLPAPKRRGRPRLHSPREILNAVFYVLKSGCQWRMLPRGLQPWKTVFHYFRAWRLDGTWERMNRALRRKLRRNLGRDPEPSAGLTVLGSTLPGTVPFFSNAGSTDQPKNRTRSTGEQKALNKQELRRSEAGSQ